MRYRDNEEVSSASLLVGDEHGRALLAVEDRVGALAREAPAERTRTRWGKHERHDGHVGRRAVTRTPALWDMSA